MKEAPPPPVAVGQVIDGKYRVKRVIGSGGMGVVVAAEHLRLGQTVALKFLLKHACENREAVSRFLREGQALARITSAHVARVMDVGTLEQGEPYLVMEYLEGSDLSVVLRQQGPLPVEEAAGYVLQGCEAIAEAHANGIIHRDLKPSNLFLTRGADGTPLIKVLDFGISKAVVQPGGTPGVEADGDAATAPHVYDTSTGALVGSPLYMSPEQIRNARRVDERTDIWSLGVILHELVCGKPPFEGETLAGTLAAVCADPPKSMSALRPDLPPELERVVLRCLEKLPERRYASIAALAVALEPLAPPGSRASVERVARVLGTPRVPGVEERASADSGGTPVATVPAWEGDTVPLSVFAPQRRKRLLRVLAILGASVVTGLLLFARSGPHPAPAAGPAVAAHGLDLADALAPPSRPSATPAASASASANTAPSASAATPEPASETSKTKHPAHPGAPAASAAAHGSKLAGTASSRRKAASEEEQDGTADRK